MRITVVASMRNEGPFIVEWVAWYRMLGFTDIAVVTNNCTDRSPELLDALQAAGWVHHIRHDVAPGERITAQKLAAAKAHKAVRRATWVFVCDVDEFLVIHKGTGRISELIGTEGQTPAFMGMAVNWRVFGTCGVDEFRDEPVHQQFALARAQKSSLSQWVKCLFRQPRLFAALGEHGPIGLDLDRIGGPWGSDNRIWVNAAGRVVPDWQPSGRPYMRRLPPGLCDHNVAQVNHYMLRSAESFSLKSGSLSPVALSNRYDTGYFQRANGGRMPDSSAFRHAEDFARLHARALRLPGVARLHALCCADHVAAIAARAGRAAQDDPRWHDFNARAEAAK
ncbi:MAG: glycosyltransferase family 2 protein [Rhodobacteraceae bacterium]|nr:glycosyltransferase family 2 protein [Paracoccaceae bacterium]